MKIYVVSRGSTWLLLLLLLLFSQAGLAVFIPRAKTPLQETPPPIFETVVSSRQDPDPRNETSIAVSATNDRVIVGTSKVIVGGGTSTSGNTRVAYYYSSDSGRTWGSGLISLETPQKTWSRASDPSVLSDADGNFYLCLLMLDNLTFDSGVYIYKSTDNGQTFSNPVAAFTDIGSGGNPKQADKCFIAVDVSPSSPFRNSVYAVWTSTENDQAGQNAAFIRLAYLRAGAQTFSIPKTISHAGDMRGPSPALGPNGEVYCAWEGIGNPKTILFNASTDGGDTFLPLSVAPSIEIAVHRFTGSLSDPGSTINIAGISRMNSFPSLAVDLSNGPDRGSLYIAWAETTNGIDSDVFLKKLSPPNGQRPGISDPVRVNNVNAGDQFFPWIAVDRTNGEVEVVFYDRRDNPGSFPVNLYVARSTDGGSSFPENLRVSTVASDPRIQASVAGSNGFGIGIGDYLAISALRGRSHVLWTDTRNAKQEIFYGQIEFHQSGGSGPLNDTCANASQIAASPSTVQLDTSLATSSQEDPVTCSGSANQGSVWYGFTPAINSTYTVDTLGSDFDTVLSVYSGQCGALTPVACNDNAAGAAAPAPSLVTFTAQAGTTYLIEVSSKGVSGQLNLRIGYPGITSVEYRKGPDRKPALRIRGAGFTQDMSVSVSADGVTTLLTTLVPEGQPQADGSLISVFASRPKLKKLIKAGIPFTVLVESPNGSGRTAVPFTFVR